MRWVVAILEVVLRVLLPALLGRSRPTAEDSRRQDELRDRLRRRVRKTWSAPNRSIPRSGVPGTAEFVCLCLAVVLLLSGCVTRTVYVPPGEPVRLRETVRGAKVWVLDSSGRPVAGVMDLPAGWYCLPDPGPTNEEE